MEKLFFDLGCVVAGILAERSGVLPLGAKRAISRLLIGVFYPLLVLTSLTSNYRIDTLVEQLYLPGGAFLLVSLGALLGVFGLRLLTFKNAQEAASFGFACSMGNFAYLPLSICLALWGERAASQLILSTLGAELGVWTVGILFFRRRSSRIKNLLNPPMAALALSLVIIVMDRETIFAALAETSVVTGAVGSLAVPMAMFILGCHLVGMSFHGLRDSRLMVVVGVRLIAIPAVFVAVFFNLASGLDGGRVLLLLSTMPAAIASVYISDLYGGDPSFAARCVFLTHTFASITIPGWIWLMNLL